MARTTATPADEQPDEAPAREEFKPYVQWTGASGLREITAEQWKAAGIENQGYVAWTGQNSRVLLSELTDEAAERLSAEPNFTFVLEAPKED